MRLLPSSWRAALILVVPLLLAATSSTVVPPLADPYAGPPKGVVATLIHASRFGKPGADAAIRKWLSANPRAATHDRAQLLQRLCSDAEIFGRYQSALWTCGAEAALTSTGEIDQDVQMARVLLGQPPLQARGTTHVPLIANKLGSRSASVVVNGFTLPWFIDTGAGVSVVSQSVAERLKVRMIKSGNVRVGTTTADVGGRMGLIRQLRIGEATIENLPVLVLPDAQLTIGNLPTIPAILGLPALVAFHRVSWLDGGRILALGADAPRAAANASRFYWHGDGVGVPISTARATRGAVLDTGANVSSLRKPGLALLSRTQQRSAVARKQRIGGAGGVVVRQHKELAKFDFRLAGSPVTLRDLPIAEDDENSAAQIGDDVIAQLGQLTLDFDTMRIAAMPLAR